jgi:hypothetical protein
MCRSETRGLFDYRRLILFDDRFPMKMEAADVAPELLSPTQPIVLPGRAAALPFHTVVGTIDEDEPPLSSRQTSSINVVESEWFDSTVLHRQSPFGAMSGRTEPVLEANDEMAGFVDHRLSSILF